MSSYVKILLAISFSMTITLAFDCVLEKPTRTNSLFEKIFLDFMRDVFLQVRCDYYQWRTGEICQDLITESDVFHGCICVIIGILSFSVAWRYDPMMINHVRAGFLTIWIVELLSRLCESIGFRSNIDCMSMYLLIWQLTSLGFQFMSQQLNSPVMFLEQGLFCIITGILSFAIFDISARYIPFEVNLAFFWLCSVIDIFFCLHPNGWLRNFYLDIKTVQLEEDKIRNDNAIYACSYQKKLIYYLKKVIIQYWKKQSAGDRPPFLYYTHSQESNKRRCHMGAGDFLAYNILLLLIISPYSSVIMKLYIAFGCVTCIVVGLILTFKLGNLVKQNLLPGVPLPVMIFSAYVLFLDIFIKYPIDCVESSSKFVHVEEVQLLS